MADELPSLSPLPRVADSAAGALPLNRIVALATPLAASAAAVLGALIVDGLSDGVDDRTRRVLMLAASLSSTAMAYKWLEGWQQYEEQEFLVENGLISAESDPSSLAELALQGEEAYPEPEPAPEDL